MEYSRARSVLLKISFNFKNIDVENFGTDDLLELVFKKDSFLLSCVMIFLT